jgi:hypothetical protein
MYVYTNALKLAKVRSHQDIEPYAARHVAVFIDLVVRTYATRHGNYLVQTGARPPLCPLRHTSCFQLYSTSMPLSLFRSRPLPLYRDIHKAHTRSWRHRRVWLLAASIAEHCFSTTSPRVDASNDISEPPLLTLNHTTHKRTFHPRSILPSSKIFLPSRIGIFFSSIFDLMMFLSQVLK